PATRFPCPLKGAAPSRKTWWICAARSRTSRLGLAMIGLPDLTGRIAVRMTHGRPPDRIPDIRVRREHVLGIVRGQLVHAGRDTLPLGRPDQRGGGDQILDVLTVKGSDGKGPHRLHDRFSRPGVRLLAAKYPQCLACGSDDLAVSVMERGGQLQAAPDCGEG